MNSEGLRVLRAVEWSERMSSAPALPLKRIATATLGGDADLAARVLAALDQQGWVRTDTMGWQSGWMTPQGRAAVTAWSDV
jgi:hypothetical protein